MALNKKGIIEVQFNWIFVLVVGAIILVFFFGFVQKQKSFAEDKNAARFITDMESILVGAQISKDAAFPVKIPRLPLSFSCDDACLCTYSMGGVSQQYKDTIIFGPDPLEGTQLILWSKEWRLPFRVSNMIFAGSEKTKYYLVYGDTALSNQWKTVLEQELPPNFDVSWINMSTELDQITFNNYPFTKIVVLDNTQLPTSFLSDMNAVFDGERANIAIIDGTDIIFYDKSSPSRDLTDAAPQHYFDVIGIYAALFSKDSQMYTCNMRHALSRWMQVAEVIEGRMDQLDEENTGNQCNYDVDDAILGPGEYNGLKSMQQEIENILSEDRIRSSSGITSGMSTFRQQNQILIQNNCPQMY